MCMHALHASHECACVCSHCRQGHMDRNCVGVQACFCACVSPLTQPHTVCVLADMCIACVLVMSECVHRHGERERECVVLLHRDLEHSPVWPSPDLRRHSEKMAQQRWPSRALMMMVPLCIAGEGCFSSPHFFSCYACTHTSVQAWTD